MLRVIPSASVVFVDAVRLARSRLGTLLVLALFPLLPLTLLGPLATEVLAALDVGVPADFFVLVVSPLALATALVGIVLSGVAGLASTVGMFVAYTNSRDVGPRAAFHIGTQRWGIFLWTEILVALAILCTAAPSLVFAWWAKETLGPLLYTEPLFGMFVLTIAVLLFLPVLVVATWYAFAPVIAARGEASGSLALAASRRLIRGAAGQTFGLLLVWFLFQLLFAFLLTLFFPGLLLLQRAIFYFTISILSTAYLFTLYQALRRS